MKTLIVIITGCIFFTNCSTNIPNGTKSSDTTILENKPVETRSPNTSYRPAFAGQTRITGIKTTTPYHATIVTSSLRRPWGIASLPDGRFLINEKSGSMRIVSQGGQVSDAITGI